VAQGTAGFVKHQGQMLPVLVLLQQLLLHCCCSVATFTLLAVGLDLLLPWTPKASVHPTNTLMCCRIQPTRDQRALCIDWISSRVWCKSTPAVAPCKGGLPARNSLPLVLPDGYIMQLGLSTLQCTC